MLDFNRSLNRGRSNYRAAAAGIAIGSAGGLLMHFVLSVVAGVGLLLRGVAAERVLPELLSDVRLPGYCAIAGVFIVLLAGYITARSVEVGPLRHALFVGVGTAVVGALLALLFGSRLESIWLAMQLIMLAPAACLGGWLAMPRLGAANGRRIDGAAT